MEFISSDRKEHVKNLLEQIANAISQLSEWNANVTSEQDYYLSPTGMQKLAASCMLIEAIGEAVNQIDKLTQGQFLVLRPEIPWEDVVGIRNHIAHGYFDIDGGIVYSTVKEDLQDLEKAVIFLLNTLK